MLNVNNEGQCCREAGLPLLLLVACAYIVYHYVLLYREIDVCGRIV